MAPMDQHLPRDYTLLLGEFPFLPAPLTPRPIGEKMVSRLAIFAASLSMPDLSREGPFDVHQDASRSGASPRVLDSVRGCQYRILVVRNLIGHTAFTCMIRGCLSKWVRLNRLDSSAVVRIIGSNIWGVRRHCWLCCSSNMTLA